MFSTSPFGMIAVSLLIGVISIGLRMWFFWAGTRAFRGSGTSAGDSHLSFDERLAEKLRDLERHEPGSDQPGKTEHPITAADRATLGPPATPLAPRGFGRRKV